MRAARRAGPGIGARAGLGTPVPAARVGTVRVLLGAYTVALLGPRRAMLREVVRTRPELFAPVGPARVLRRPLPPRVADALTDATLVSSALFTLGVGHRVVGPLHAALLGWTLSYRNSWSMVFHTDNLLVLHTVAIGAAQATDAVSLSAIRRRAGRPALPAAVPHPRYGWPLLLMNATTAAVYLLAGVAKVAGESGWAWARGDQLRRQVAIDGLRKELFGSRIPPVAMTMYRHRVLFTAMAVASLAVELAAPLALLDRRLGRMWAVAAFGMHWGILAIMDIKFRYQLTGTVYASWFDVERVVDALARVWRG